jgi:hypothetical protein
VEKQRKRLTEAEAKAREERLKAMGVTVEQPTTATILLAAKAAGVEVTVRQRPKGGGEIAPLPGIRRDEKGRPE